MSSTNKRTLREWRAYLNFTKQDMAKLIGVHPSTYAKWEQHPESIRVVDVFRIAEKLKCGPEEIIFFEGKPSFKLGNTSSA
jgi:transcriptional regulator with XRE-family HTH domain